MADQRKREFGGEEAGGSKKSKRVKSLNKLLNMVPAEIEDHQRENAMEKMAELDASFEQLKVLCAAFKATRSDIKYPLVKSDIKDPSNACKLNNEAVSHLCEGLRRLKFSLKYAQLGAAAFCRNVTDDEIYGPEEPISPE